MEENVFTSVEKAPNFPTGYPGLYEYFWKNFKFSASEELINSGKYFFINFIVRKDGRCDSFKIIKSSIDPKFEKEVMQVFNSMSNWYPGENGKQKVDTYVTLGFHFLTDFSKKNIIEEILKQKDSQNKAVIILNGKIVEEISEKLSPSDVIFVRKFESTDCFRLDLKTQNGLYLVISK